MIPYGLTDFSTIYLLKTTRPGSSSLGGGGHPGGGHPGVIPDSSSLLTLCWIPPQVSGLLALPATGILVTGSSVSISPLSPQSAAKYRLLTTSLFPVLPSCSLFSTHSASRLISQKHEKCDTDIAHFIVLYFTSLCRPCIFNQLKFCGSPVWRRSIGAILQPHLVPLCICVKK